MAVDGLLQEGVETIGRRQGADVETQVLVVAGAHQHFLTPVAQDVGSQARVALRPVVKLAVVHLQQGLASVLLGDVFRHGFVIEHFAQQVAVPPNGHVDGDACHAVHYLAANVAKAATATAPHLQTRIRGVDIGRHAASHIGLVRQLEDDPSCSCIAEVAAVALIFVAVPHLQAVVEREEAGHMHGIAVTEARGVESLAVVVHSHRTVGNLVAAIAVHISHAQVVIALSGISPAHLIRVEDPSLLQFAAIEVPCRQHCASVVAAAHHHRRTDTVQIGHAGQVAFAAIGIVVAPILQFAPFGYIVNCVDGAPRRALEDSQIFGAFEDESAASRPPGHIGPSGTSELLTRIAVGMIFVVVQLAHMVGRGVANDRTLAVDGSVARLAHQFGTSVAVEVVHHELGVVGARTDVPAEVDSPKTLAACRLAIGQLIGIEEGIVGEARLRIVLRVRRVPLQDDFQLSVAVQVGHRGIAGRIAHFATVHVAESHRSAYGNVEIPRRSILGQDVCRLLPHLTIHDGAHLVLGAPCRRVTVHEGSALSVAHMPHPLAVAQDVELHVRRVLTQIAPREQDAVRRSTDGHYSAVEPFHLYFRIIVARLGMGGNEELRT